MQIFGGGEELLQRSDVPQWNLIPGTYTLSGFSMTPNGGSIDNTKTELNQDSEMITSPKIAHLWGNNAIGSGVKLPQSLYLTKGIYTLSFLCRHNDPNNNGAYPLGLYDDSATNNKLLGQCGVRKTFEKTSITFAVTESKNYDSLRIGTTSGWPYPSGSIYLGDLKLEHGNLATSWAPALQDFAMKSDYDKLLGIGNLLTDDEMNIANALKNTAAQGAISNINYSNGVSRFHYKGTVGYEVINWPFKVSPNTSYRMEIVVNSTNELTALSNGQPYMPWGINSQEDLNDNASGDIGNWQLPLPWSKEISGSITFNSGSYSELYLISNFGFASDGIDTDMALQIKLFESDSIQAQIDQLRSQIEQLKQK